MIDKKDFKKTVDFKDLAKMREAASDMERQLTAAQAEHDLYRREQASCLACLDTGFTKALKAVYQNNSELPGIKLKGDTASPTEKVEIRERLQTVDDLVLKTQRRITALEQEVKDVQQDLRRQTRLTTANVDVYLQYHILQAADPVSKKLDEVLFSFIDDIKADLNWIQQEYKITADAQVLLTSPLSYELKKLINILYGVTGLLHMMEGTAQDAKKFNDKNRKRVESAYKEMFGETKTS